MRRRTRQTMLVERKARRTKAQKRSPTRSCKWNEQEPRQWATLKTSVSGHTHTHTHRYRAPHTHTHQRNATEMPQSSNKQERKTAGQTLTTLSSQRYCTSPSPPRSARPQLPPPVTHYTALCTLITENCNKFLVQKIIWSARQTHIKTSMAKFTRNHWKSKEKTL